MLKNFVSFALLFAIAGGVAVTSADAQRLVVRSITRTDGGIVSKTMEPTAALEPDASASFDPAQCANGGVNNPPQSCGSSGANNWDTGNMNGSKAHYPEGSNIHYRYVFGNLTPGVEYKIRIGYDAWEGTAVAGQTAHTIDYLNTYDAGIDGAAIVGYTVNPCGGVANCVPGNFIQFDIPDDPTLSPAIEPAPGVRKFTGWNISSGSAIFENPANPLQGERVIEITFTPTVSNPVLAWSGHVASTIEWNQLIPGDGGAGTQKGSPYHMRNAGNATFTGQKELQMAATAVQTAPSAAGVEVSGRVTDYFGRAILGAQLTLFNAMTGEPQVAYTNAYGYYSFGDVPAGEFYVLSVAHRRYTFVTGSVSFSLEDNLAGLDFTASR